MSGSHLCRLAYVCVLLASVSAHAEETFGVRLEQPFSLHAGQMREVTPPGIEVSLRSLSAESGCLAADDCSAMLFRGTLVLRLGARTELHALDALVGPDAPYRFDVAGFDLELGDVRPDASGVLAATFTLLEHRQKDTDEVPHHVLINPDGAGASTPGDVPVATTRVLIAPPAIDRSDLPSSPQATHILLRAADRDSAANFVPIWIEPRQASLSSSGWMLFFHTALPLSKLEVRPQGRPDWTNITGPIGDVHEFYGGFGLFDAKIVIEARALTPDGRTLGPYLLPFDALTALREQDMRTLRDAPDSWVEVAKDYVEFATFYECSCAIREVRYSIDGKGLEKRVKLPPCSLRHHGELPADDAEILRLENAPTFVAFQVVFYDGTMSPVKVVREGKR